MTWANGLIAVALLMLAAFLWAVSAGFPDGARLFPRLILIILGSLCLVYFAVTFLPAVVRSEDGEGEKSIGNMTVPMLVFLSAVVAVGSMRFAGFLPACFALGSALFFILGVERRGLYWIGLFLALALIEIGLVRGLGVPLWTRELFGGTV